MGSYKAINIQRNYQKVSKILEFISGNEATTYAIRAKRNYDVGLSSYAMKTIRIIYISLEEGDSLVIKGYLREIEVC